jgi:hypothetical protein
MIASINKIIILNREECSNNLSIMQSKSWARDGVSLRYNAVSCGGGLSPDPAATDVVMVEDSPKIIFSS